MNYKNMYNKLVETRKEIMSIRKIDRNLYEAHHIVPKCLGGTNAESNLVLLTFKEHFVAHLLLLKITTGKDKSKMWSALSILGAKYSKEYEKNKTTYWKFYKKENHPMYGNTHSDIAKKIISNARTGKMPAIDINTREKVGSVSLTHPKVLSGEWVHHTTGRKASLLEKQKLSNRNSGMDNPNNKSRVTKEWMLDLIDQNKSSCIFNDHFYATGFNDLINLAKDEINYKKLSGKVMIKNRFGTITNMIDEYNKKFNSNIIYNPYYREYPTYKAAYKNQRGKIKC